MAFDILALVRMMNLGLDNGGCRRKRSRDCRKERAQNEEEVENNYFCLFHSLSESLHEFLFILVSYTLSKLTYNKLNNLSPNLTSGSILTIDLNLLFFIPLQLFPSL